MSLAVTPSQAPTRPSAVVTCKCVGHKCGGDDDDDDDDNHDDDGDDKMTPRSPVDALVSLPLSASPVEMEFSQDNGNDDDNNGDGYDDDDDNDYDDTDGDDHDYGEVVITSNGRRPSLASSSLSSSPKIKPASGSIRLTH